MRKLAPRHHILVTRDGIMATATHAVGRIGEYDPQSKSIMTYLERLALYTEANGVANDKKVAVLLTVIGPKTYGIRKSLLSPTLPQDKSLDALAGSPQVAL